MKFSLRKWALAALVMIAGSALAEDYPTLYYTGDFTSPSWSATGALELDADAEGNYVINLNSKGEAEYQFKVSTVKADWDTGFNANALGLNDQVTNGTYNLEVGNSNNIITTKGSGKATIRKNGDTWTLTIDGNWAAVNTGAPTDVNLRGDYNSWGTTKMTLKAQNTDAQGYYVYTTGTLPKAITGTFKIADANWGSFNYGAGSEATVPANKRVEAFVNSQTNFTVAGSITDAEVLFYYNPNGQKFVEIKAATGEVTYPENMYVIGKVADCDWNPTQGVKMVNEGDGIYTVEDLQINEYFALTTALGANDNDWGTMNAGRMGPNGDGIAAIIGENKIDGFGDNKTWKIEPGKYNLTVSLEDMILDIEAVEVAQPAPQGEWYYNISGTFNGWGSDNGQQPGEALNTLTWENLALGTAVNADDENPTGHFEVKVWNGIADVYYGNTDGFKLGEAVQLYENGGHMAVEADADALYNVTIDVKNNTILVEKVVVEEPEPEPALGLNLVWQKDNGYIPAAFGDVRLGTGYNGTVYVNNKAQKKVIALDKDGNAKDFAQLPADGVGISTDDAGNIIASRAFGVAKNSTDFTVISADGSKQKDITLTLPEGIAATRTDLIGRATGDIFSAEGGRFYLAMSGVDRVVAVDIKNGGEDVATSASFSFKVPALTNQPVAVPVGENFALRARSAGNGSFYLSDGSALNALPQKGAASGANEGGDVFVLGGKMYQVVPSKINATTNYTNEFTFYDEDGTAIQTVTLGGATPSINNNSYMASVTARVVSNSQAEIYLVGIGSAGVSYAMYTYTIEAPEVEPQPELVGEYDIFMQPVLDFQGTLGEAAAAKLAVYKEGDKYYMQNENFVANVPFTINGEGNAQVAGDAENDPMWGAFLLNPSVDYQPTYAFEYNAEKGFSFAGNEGILWMGLEDGSFTAYLLLNEMPAEKLEPATYADRVKSSVEQDMGEGAKTFNYNLEYSVTRNADKTLTISGAYNYKGEAPVGAVDTYSIYIDQTADGGRMDQTEGVKDGEAGTTAKTFNDGDVIYITFAKAIATKNMEDKVAYTVGSEQEMPAEEIEYDINGNLNAQFDMSMGAGEDLLEAQDWPVKALYKDGKLYLTALADAEEPIVMVVNTEDWTVAADGKQLSTKDDGDPEYVIEYYYGDIESQQFTVLGEIRNISDTQSQITLKNWGEAMDWDGGLFFNTAYFNSVLTLDYVFEGAPLQEAYTRPDVEDYEGGVELASKGVYAYDIKVTPYEGDLTKAVVQYRLNGKAKSVSIQALIDGTPVDGAVTEGTVEHNNTVEVALPAGTYTGELTYEITATRADDVEKATLITDQGVTNGVYRFYAPYGLAVNNAPESETFGRIITNERSYWPDGTGTTTYHSYTSTKSILGGLYAFDPQMQPIKAEDGSYCFQVGLGTKNDAKITVYDYFRLKFTSDGRLYMSSADVDKYGIYEIDPNDLDATAQPVLEEKGKAIWGFDIYGEGDNRKLVTFWNNGEGSMMDIDGTTTNGVAWKSAAVSSYDLAEDNTATAPYLYKTLSHTNFGGDTNYSWLSVVGANVAIDADGKGFYVIHGRGGDQVAAQVRLAHASIEDGTIDELVTRKDANLTFAPLGGAIAYNHDHTLLAMAYKSAVVAIYQVSDAAAAAEVTDEPAPKGMTKVAEIATTIGGNTNALAFDYANNLYICSNSGEKLISFQLPASIAGESSTVPSRKADAITLENTTTGVGNVAVDAIEVGPATYYNLNGVRMNGNNLPAGVYIKVVGKTATKVVIR